MPILDQFGRPYPSPMLAKASSLRAHRRASIEAAYDAAQTTRENAKHWRWADNLSAAQANAAHVRKPLRERARYEIANNSFAAGIVDTLANDVIGVGPRLQVITPDAAVNAAIEARWKAWCKSRNLATKLRTGRKARCGDGEVFLMKSNNRRGANRIELDVKLVECDQFEDPYESNTDPRHVAGVHLDEDGNPTAYDMLESHPGDPRGEILKDRPIDADDVIHWFRADRPGQIRGVPEITPALPLFAMLRRYTLAVLLAAETAADFAAVLETVSAPFDDEGNPDIAEVDPFDSVDIDRGMMTSIPRGWKMNQFKPEQPVTTYKQFRDAILNEIARCLNMPANKARCDSSGYNYASGRLDHGTYYESIDVDRNQCEIEVIDRIFGWWLDEAMLIPGYLPPMPTFEDGLSHRWYWNGHKHSDPTKEANAAKTLHALGLLTDEAYLLGEGIDPEEHFEQLKRQHKRRAELAKLSPQPPQPANQNTSRRGNPKPGEPSGNEANDTQPQKAAA
jgi:lambda family phage portal protein